MAAKLNNFIRPGYVRNYPDTSTGTEFPVYVESKLEDEKIGNKNPLSLSKNFKTIKRIHEQRRMNAQKIMLVFKTASMANDLLKNKC